MQTAKARYPFYMYHHDEDEPRRVDDTAQEVALENKGWVIHYIHKEYPKWVNGVTVKSKEEHDKLIGKKQTKPLPEVVKVTLEENIDKTGEPIVTEKPIKKGGRPKGSKNKKRKTKR